MPDWARTMAGLAPTTITNASATQPNEGQSIRTVNRLGGSMRKGQHERLS